MHLLYPTYVLCVLLSECGLLACVESSAQIQAAGTRFETAWIRFMDTSEEKFSFSVRREVSDRTGIFSIVYQEVC